MSPFCSVGSRYVSDYFTEFITTASEPQLSTKRTFISSPNYTPDWSTRARVWLGLWKQPSSCSVAGALDLHKVKKGVTNGQSCGTVNTGTHSFRALQAYVSAWCFINSGTVTQATTVPAPAGASFLSPPFMYLYTIQTWHWTQKTAFALKTLLLILQLQLELHAFISQLLQTFVIILQLP